MLYLANYFSELKAIVDLNFALKQLNEKDAEKKNKLTEIWQQMIQTIELFEKECISKNKQNRFEDIETKLKLFSNKSLLELKETFKTTLRKLFQNKTIALFHSKASFNGLIDIKLVILNDTFMPTEKR